MLPEGDSALLVEFDSLAEALGFYRAADAARPRGVVELVPGARTVLAICEVSILPLVDLRRWLKGIVSSSSDVLATGVVEVPVRYDGVDLDEVAGILDLTPAEVVELHTNSIWTVAFGGFAPGFGYLVTNHSRLRVPRRSSPRLLVPAGAVGLAGEFSGIYPRPSPGGWQLIGTTEVVLFDQYRTPPSTLTPGTTVRFVAE
ncbi:MAG: 5-oxoprolinase subunit PxpB [Salinibacterium sp.]|nr:5-oxoprolinase subunit PxpB [Salinibacterium sp.]